MTLAAVPSAAVDAGVWAGIALSVSALLALVGKWFIAPAIKEAIRTEFAPAIGEVVGVELRPFVERLNRLEEAFDSLNNDLRVHMTQEDNRRKP